LSAFGAIAAGLSAGQQVRYTQPLVQYQSTQYQNMSWPVVFSFCSGSCNLREAVWLFLALAQIGPFGC
jgi:hypothetical protein